MSQWSLTNPSRENLHLEWFLYNHILIKIHSAGQYPILVRKDGTFDNEVPHVEVILGYFHEKNKIYYNDVSVRVYSPKKNRPSIVMTVWKSGAQPKNLSADILINLAKMQFSHALELLKNMKDEFKKSKERVKEARAYPTIFNTRAAYESACKKLNVEALSDEICKSYGVQYGTFQFPDYTGNHCLKMKLARRRLRGLLKSAKNNPEQKHSIPEKAATLHMPCKVCEREPCFMPLHLCEHCWPKE